jgi:hypothetical protein
MINKVQKIDVSGLPDEEIKILQRIDAIFKERRQKARKRRTVISDKGKFLKPHSLGKIKGNPGRKEIYDHL